MALFGNGQTFEYMINRCLDHKLGEVRWTAQSALEELSKIIPAFFRRVQTEDAKRYRNYLSGKEIGQIADEVMKLIEPDKHQATHQFWQKYSAYLSSADIIMKHSTVKDLIARLKPNM